MEGHWKRVGSTQNSSEQTGPGTSSGCGVAAGQKGEQTRRSELCSAEGKVQLVLTGPHPGLRGKLN